MVSNYRKTGDSFQAEKPRLWSDMRLQQGAQAARLNFTLHPDGKRFVVVDAPGNGSEEKRDHLVFIFNFFEELRRLAPANR